MYDLEELALAEELDRRMACTNFLAFYMRMTGFNPPLHIRVIARHLQAMEEDKIDRLMLFAPPRHGKRCADTTPILTANRGWTAHGNLRVGDQVWHPSGRPVAIVHVHEPDLSDQIVTFSNGEHIKCDRGHLWTVQDQEHRRRDSHRGEATWLTVSTQELRAKGLHIGGPKGRRGSRQRWHLPESLGIDGAEIQTEMGPYTLGVWLGDGTVGKPRITMAPDDMALVLTTIEAEGYAVRKRYVHATTGVHSAAFTETKRKPRGRKAKLTEHLEAEGVFRDKHVPAHWLTASRRQRLELLAGLMDTDGHCEPETGRCRIVTGMPRLAETIHDLCASLGFRPYVTAVEPNGAGPRGGIQTKSTIYTVGFQPHEPIPCRLERKRPARFALRRAVSIVSIEDAESESARCITVDSPDGLYLVGRKLVPTHNSLLGSILFPAWIMGRHPSTKIMSVVHTQGYARKIGRNVRNLLRSPAWPFTGQAPIGGEYELPQDDEEEENEDLEQYLEGADPVSVARDSRRAEQWATTAGGEYNGFGIIGGNMHGSPAEWLLTDDIVKGRKIALSPHMREEVWETYKTDLLSRLQGRSKQVKVITRWHQDDPPGRVLPEKYDGRSGWFRDRETKEPWYVLSLPAVSEHDNDPLGRAKGEWLWPERFGDKSVLPGMRARGGWIWSSLYQQRPSPEEGLMFNRAHLENRFNPATLDLTGMQIYGGSDYAVTEAGTSSENPDWTVHLVVAVDPDRTHYLVDGWRGRTSPDKWIKEWVRLVLKHHPLRWFEEAGQIIKAVGPMILQAMEDEDAFTDRVQMASTTDKASRAQSLLAIASVGKLRLPMLAEVPPGPFRDLLEAFEKELLEFPGGTKDDTVDAAALIARGRTIAGSPPPRRRSPHGDTLDDLFERYEAQEERRRP